MARNDGFDRTICLTGPESTGKATLAHQLAERFHAPLVPEVARAYLGERSSYGPDDLLEIARLQLAFEQPRAASKGSDPLDAQFFVTEHGARPTLRVERPVLEDSRPDHEIEAAAQRACGFLKSDDRAQLVTDPVGGGIAVYRMRRGDQAPRSGHRISDGSHPPRQGSRRHGHR